MTGKPPAIRTPSPLAPLIPNRIAYRCAQTGDPPLSQNTQPNAKDDRRVWRRKTPMAERIVMANKLIVLHPRFREALNVLKRCRESLNNGGEPSCGAVLPR